jgi:hypothetical protein
MSPSLETAVKQLIRNILTIYGARRLIAVFAMTPPPTGPYAESY